ncbi:hypothetical protein [Paraburkholderia acidipaludis]|uniref:hypothetical protein n=1 Tax=Paraburkholderia acidipaludis TaxID=660537 RepID=UPI000483C5A7|nr:hypothetical protein [Paraburkholderia acidipaludis]
MKPLLRVVLIVDALMLLGFGVLFLLTPWASLYDALQLVQPQPALVGQVFGVVLLGFAWLVARAAFDGAMTAPVGRAAGHVNWIAGVLMLIWLIGLHTPRLTGFGQLVAGGVGVWLILIGFGVARLAGAVRRRDKALAIEAAAAQREARNAAKRDSRAEPATYAEPVFAGASSSAAVPAAAERVQREPAPAQPVTQPHYAEPPAAADSEEARLAARDEAAGAPRPPLHG